MSVEDIGKKLFEFLASIESSLSVDSAQSADAISLAGPIVRKDSAKRIVTAPVLVPGEKDSDDEVVTEEQVEGVAIEWMEKYQIVDKGHSFNAAAVPVESWILRKEEMFGDMVLPKGAWMMSAKIKDNETWNGILNEKYKGFSITAARREDAPATKSAATADKRKTLLRDLGEDFVVITVSVVEDPAVWKSKWVAIKSKDENGNLIQRLLNRFHIKSDKQQKQEGRTSQFGDMEDDMDEEKIKAAMKDALGDLTQLVADLVKRVEAIEGKGSDSAGKETAAATEPATDAKPEPEKQTTAPEKDPVAVKLAEAKNSLLELYEDEEDVEGKDDKIKVLKAHIAILEDMLGTVGKGEGEGDSGEGDAALKSKVLKFEKFQKDVEKALAAKSRGIVGQDGETGETVAKKEQGPQRDTYGRRIQ